MRKITLDHISAISHAETYIQPAIIQNMSPHHRKSIEDDLTRLSEVKRFLLRTMYEPGLPMTTIIPDPEPDDGDTC